MSIPDGNNPITIMLTNHFPFGEAGETFIETEILYNKQATLIFALTENAKKNIKIKRKTPENCKIFSISDYSLLKKVYCLVIVFLMKETWSELYLLIKQGKFRLFTIVKLLNFVWKGLCSFYFIKDTLKKEGISKNRNFIFYAYWMHIPAYAALLLSKYFTNSKIITRCHGYDLYLERSRHGYSPLRNVLSSQMDNFYPCSQNGANYLSSRYGIDESKIKVMRLGTLDHGKNTGFEDRKTLKIVSCSSVIAVKRVHLIIEAIIHITDINISWTHLGGGELLSNMQTHSHAMLTHMPNVHYTWCGAISNKDVLAFYSNNPIHAFINASESEGVPVSIMEALSFGIPVIATAVGGTPEIVESGTNGFLLPENLSAKEIATVLRQIYTMSDSDYLNLRRNARAGWDNMSNADIVYPIFYENITSL